MNKIIDIEDGKPHQLAEMICVGCHDRGIHVFPEATPLKDLECSKCGKVGLMICTGENLEDG